MNTYEFTTIIIAIASIMVSGVLCYFTIRSSNKSTRLIAKALRENSRVISSEHLTLYRIEAFYNAVAIQNLDFKIDDIYKKLNSAEEKDRETLETKLRYLQMNHKFMKIREQKIINTDFALQEEISNLYKEMKIN